MHDEDPAVHRSHSGFWAVSPAYVVTKAAEPQLVELATAIGWENHRAHFNRTFGIATENFSEGAFCPLPEGSNNLR